jgi:hypothetical protein
MPQFFLLPLLTEPRKEGSRELALSFRRRIVAELASGQ